jgi:hypothetical protein
MKRKLLLLISFFIPLAVSPLYANICSQSDAQGYPGIGDGCSTHYAEYAIPSVGVFKGAFTNSCNKHDKCYSQLGADYSGCDSDFYANMRSDCSSNYNPILLGPIYADCLATANLYYSAVSAWRGSGQVETRDLQYDALSRSNAMQSSVDADTCGTTPERTTIYAPGLITRINTSFQTYAGRKPTLYEFLDAVNWWSGTQNFVSDQAAWSGALYNKSVAAASASPPTVGWWLDYPGAYGVTFRANPVVSGASYLWKVGTTGTGPTLAIGYSPPLYDRKITYSGFLKATGSNGARNMALIETSVTLPGTCATKPGPNVHCN